MGKASRPGSSKTPQITKFFQYMSPTATPKTKENTHTIESFFRSTLSSQSSSQLQPQPQPQPQPKPQPEAVLAPVIKEEHVSTPAQSRTKADTSVHSSKLKGDPESIPSSDDPFSNNPFNDDFDTFGEDPNYHVQDHDDYLDLSKDIKHSPRTFPQKVSSNPTSPRNKFLAEPSPFESEPDPIDHLVSFDFGSQVSGESLRRLTLSPRKPKRKDLGPLASPPLQSFKDKLAAVMDKEMLSEGGTTGDSFWHLSSNSQEITAATATAPKVTPKVETGNSDVEDVVIEGSDPDSEADWNDDRVFGTSPCSEPPESLSASDAEPSPSSPKSVNGTKPVKSTYDLSSDDDLPDLQNLKSKRLHLESEESDSDLEDHPFEAIVSKKDTSSTPSTPMPALAPLSLESDIDLRLSEDEDEAITNATQRPTRRSTRNMAAAKKQVVTPPIPTRKPAPKKPALFSLDVLLKEKKRREKSGYDLNSAASGLVLDDGLLQEIKEEDYLDIDSKPVIPKGVLSEEQEEALNEIIQEEETDIVEDIVEFFVHWPKEMSIEPLELEDVDCTDTVMLKVVKHTRTALERNSFLCSPYLMVLCSSIWPMPRVLFRWLVHVVSIEKDQMVCQSVFGTLQRSILRKSNLLGVDYEDIVRAFRSYGAKDEYLLPGWQVQPVTRETSTERNIPSDAPKFPRSNLKILLKLVNLSATQDPLFYDAAEIRRIVILLLSITTDPIIGDVQSLLGVTLAALLDAIPSPVWGSEWPLLCEEINKNFGTSLPFILLILHRLPAVSERLQLTRRNVAIMHLGLTPLRQGQTSPDLEEIHKALYVDAGFMVSSKTDYKALGRRIQVLGYCLDDEEMIAAYGRQALEPIVQKLKVMHGRIVDVRAAFMERTLTKDMIQRLVTRLYFGAIHRQGSRQTVLNFAVAS